MVETVYLDSYAESESIFADLSQPVGDWFKETFPDFTEPQKLAIPSIIAGKHLLLCSPTGSGKTLTAFLSILDNLIQKSLNGELEERVYCVYISPIKALANDIQKFSAVVARAHELLETLTVHTQQASDECDAGTGSPQMSLFTEYLQNPLVDELKTIDLDAMSPMEAFDVLRDLSRRASGEDGH